MIARGAVGNTDQLGLEASGVVRRVGLDVHDFQVGDKVGIVGSGMFQTRITVPIRQCWKLPESFPLDHAATMQVAYLTAMYALLHLAGLSEGQVRRLHQHLWYFFSARSFDNRQS